MLNKYTHNMFLILFLYPHNNFSRDNNCVTIAAAVKCYKEKTIAGLKSLKEFIGHAFFIILSVKLATLSSLYICL